MPSLIRLELDPRLSPKECPRKLPKNPLFRRDVPGARPRYAKLERA